MRAYWNNTGKPITYKTWALDIEHITQNNLKFLKAYDVTARICYDQESFSTVSGQRYYYGNKGHAEFLTTCSDQESMLQLLYGDKLILVSVETVLPNSISYNANSSMAD